MSTAVFTFFSPQTGSLLDAVARHHPDWVGYALPGSRAALPGLFGHLFWRGHDRVVYLDPAATLTGPLAELDAAAPPPFLILAPRRALIALSRRPQLGELLTRWRTDDRAPERCAEAVTLHFGGLKAPPPPARPLLAARLARATYRTLSNVRPLVRLVPAPLRAEMRNLLLGYSRRRRQALLPPGLNVVGYAGVDSGVGESSRLCRNACAAAGLASELVDLASASGAAPRAVYRASVFHVNADETPSLADRIPAVLEASAYRIGCWHWELPELPDAWIASADLLHEIWAPSAFIQRAVSGKLKIPVVHMPHGIQVTAIEPCSPRELGVPPGCFTFLCMFDLASVPERKNPLAAVDAFARAFPDDPSAALLIKVSHAATHPDEYAALAERVRGLRNVYLSDRMLSRARVNGLLAACDAVVSLHRSEGFGLILAEAMALGKVVIATGWSGNMDFMNADNSCPVEHALVVLDRSHRVYAAGQIWAEPDVDHAAHLMRRVAGDATFRTLIGARAQATMQGEFSPRAAGLRYQRRLAALGLL